MFAVLLFSVLCVVILLCCCVVASLFCSVLFCSVLFCSVLFCSILFCSVLFSSLLFSSLLFSSLLFCSVCVCVVGRWLLVSSLLLFFLFPLSSQLPSVPSFFRSFRVVAACGVRSAEAASVVVLHASVDTVSTIFNGFAEPFVDGHSLRATPQTNQPTNRPTNTQQQLVWDGWMAALAWWERTNFVTNFVAVRRSPFAVRRSPFVRSSVRRSPFAVRPFVRSSVIGDVVCLSLAAVRRCCPPFPIAAAVVVAVVVVVVVVAVSWFVVSLPFCDPCSLLHNPTVGTSLLADEACPLLAWGGFIHGIVDTSGARIAWRFEWVAVPCEEESELEFVATALPRLLLSCYCCLRRCHASEMTVAARN